MKIKHIFTIGMLAGMSLQGMAHAQQSDGVIMSFGNRIPSKEDLGRIFMGPAQSPEGIQAKGIVQAQTRNKGKSFDIDLAFAFGSDTLSAKGQAQLAPIGEYLKAVKLNAGAVAIDSHMNGLGSSDFTNDLSLRRAQAIKGFLVSEYNLDPSVFVVAGLGKQQPKDKGNLASEANRRIQFSVQIAN